MLGRKAPLTSARPLDRSAHHGPDLEDRVEDVIGRVRLPGRAQPSDLLCHRGVRDPLIMVGVIIAWLVIQRWLLPRLGVST